jgi:hypothetical protein
MCSKFKRRVIGDILESRSFLCHGASQPANTVTCNKYPEKGKGKDPKWALSEALLRFFFLLVLIFILASFFFLYSFWWWFHILQHSPAWQNFDTSYPWLHLGTDKLKQKDNEKYHKRYNFYHAWTETDFETGHHGPLTPTPAPTLPLRNPPHTGIRWPFARVFIPYRRDCLKKHVVPNDHLVINIMCTECDCPVSKSKCK